MCASTPTWRVAIARGICFPGFAARNACCTDRVIAGGCRLKLSCVGTQVTRGVAVRSRLGVDAISSAGVPVVVERAPFVVRMVLTGTRTPARDIC